MNFTRHAGMRICVWMGMRLGEILLAALMFPGLATGQALGTTSVQGTVYLANGQTGAGTLTVSWPSFTTAAGQAIAAGHTTITIGTDGFVSVNLAPNQGATPAGLYYTATYYLSDGTTSTEYWMVPAVTQAALANVRTQVMPAAQAVQAVNKAYVDQSISELTQSLLTASGGNLNGALYLNGDPTQPNQAADKHYVDGMFAQSLPLIGGAASGPVTATKLGAAYQVDQLNGVDFGAKLQTCINKLNSGYGGICDARNFSGTLGMASSVTLTTANVNILLPCATIVTSNQFIVPAGTRNVSLRGCSLRGGSTASGNQGGTVFQYTGTGAMIQVGDPTYAIDTPGFHMDNAVLSTTAASSATAQGLVAYRTQELDLESLYFLGNANQVGMTLDGTGNYTGGTFFDDTFNGFLTAVSAIGHQATNPATTDWVNASSFVRLHIDCPTSSGSPISGTTGINLVAGDGNTFTGGDVEGCATALHLGTNAQNNTIIGLRNENSNSQVVADAGSAYNNWITGGTMFTGKLTDNGTRNSFLDTFHRSFNTLNGDWYSSQQDATVTNHYRLGIGTGAERGLQNRYQTDYGYRWTTGLSDASEGEQFYQVLDELNNVYRLSIGQYNHGQSSTNNQTVINAAGSGAVVLNGSNNAGTGGVVIGSGGPSETTVATIDNTGNAQFNGTLQVSGGSTFNSSTTVRNQADAEIDAFLWAGATAPQKEAFTYKDYTGASQWYMVKDGSNNWALNSATGGLDSFKAYQSNNSGDTYINASNAGGHIRLNYETGAGAETDIYSGSSTSLAAAFQGPTSIKLPGLAAASGDNCLQIDNSGYISNTGAACGSGGSGSGTVNSASSGQIAYYTSNGSAIGGLSAVPVAAGGTGAQTAAAAVANLLPGVSSDSASGIMVAGSVAVGASVTLAGSNLVSTVAAMTSGTITVGSNQTLTSTLTIPAGVTVQCAKGVKITRGFNGVGIYLTGSGSGLAGCELDANSTTGDLIWVNGASNFLIANNKIHGMHGVCDYGTGYTYCGGVYLNTATNGIISGNNIYDTGIFGIFGQAGVTGNTISNNTVATSSKSAGQIHNATSGVIGIGWQAESSGTATGNKIIGNHITANYMAFCVAFGGWGGVSQQNTVSANDCNVGENSAFGGYSTVSEAGSSVTGNTFASNGYTTNTGGYEVGGYSMTVSGNQFDGGGTAIGMSLNQLSNSVITGNTIKNFSTYGMNLVVPSNGTLPASGNLVSGNTIVWPSTGSALVGVNVTANASGSVVSNNKVNGNEFDGSGSTNSGVGIQIYAVAGGTAAYNDTSGNTFTGLLSGIKNYTTYTRIFGETDAADVTNGYADLGTNTDFGSLSAVQATSNGTSSSPTLGWTGLGTSGGLSGFSRDSAGDVALTADGKLQLTVYRYGAAIWNPLGTATSSANYSSLTQYMDGSYWTGTAAATGYVTQSLTFGSGANPSTHLTFNKSGSTGPAFVDFSNFNYLDFSGTGGQPATLTSVCATAACTYTFPDVASGTVAMALKGTTGSIGGSALTAGTCASGTATITGATTAMACFSQPSTGTFIGGAFTENCTVTAANTATVNVCTTLAAGGTPTAATHTVRVIQ